MADDQKPEDSSRMRLGAWHSLASGCDKVTPEQAYAAVRVHTVPGDAKRRRDGWPDKNRFYDYVWLVYSVFFFIEPIARHNLRYWLQFAAVYTLFLAIYSGLVYARTKLQSYLLLMALCVLGLWYLPYNNWACGILVYVAAFIPFISESLGSRHWALSPFFAALLPLRDIYCISVHGHGDFRHFSVLSLAAQIFSPHKKIRSKRPNFNSRRKRSNS